MLAASGFASLLLVLIALGCPLMMIVMMRGMHGGGRNGGHADRSQRSLDELKRERDELNEQIAHRAEETVHANH